MFKAIISAEKLKDALESVFVLVDECKFRINNEGISVRAVEPANVTMVSFEISSSAFESYEATEGELGIDLLKLSDIIAMAEKGDNVELSLDENSHKFIIKMQAGKLSYTISLLDPSSIKKEPKVPALELPAQVVLAGGDLRRAIKAAEKIGEYMTMGTYKDIFYMEAEGDTDKVRLEMTKDQLIDINFGEAHSLFSIEYLTKIIKSAGKSNEVLLELGKDYPLKVSFKIADGRGTVKYMLAPRVETEK